VIDSSFGSIRIIMRFSLSDLKACPLRNFDEGRSILQIV